MLLVKDDAKQDCYKLDRNCEEKFGSRKWRIIKSLFLRGEIAQDYEALLKLIKSLSSILDRVRRIKQGRGEVN